MAHAAMVDCYLHHLLVQRFGGDLEVVDGGSTTGTRQMALPIGDASHDEDGDSTDGQVEPGILVGASVGGYL